MSKNNSVNGTSFFSWITLLFIALKLTGVVGWSWWWVLSPSWIPIVIIALFFLVVGIVGIIGAIKKRRK